MATYEFEMRGVVLSKQLIEEICGAVAPFALSELKRQADGTPSLPGSGGFENTPDRGMRIALGGVPRIANWTVLDRDSIEHHAGTNRSAPHALWRVLDGYQRLVVELDGGPVSIQLRGSGVRAETKVTASSRIIKDLADVIRHRLGAFVDPQLLQGDSPPFKVFIGHGGDPQWKYLHRALNETHRITAEAFESSERAGYHTLVVVDQMVRTSTMAVVVMTGEDALADGTLRARENVVHEVGFCQGALGIDRTIVVLEDGVSEPTNISGLTQIRFPKGRLIDVEAKIVEAIELRRQAHEYQFGSD